MNRECFPFRPTLHLGRREQIELKLRHSSFFEAKLQNTDSIPNTIWEGEANINRNYSTRGPMLCKPHGKTGAHLSVIGFGGMHFEDIDNRDDCVAMMLEAAHSGINYFDTAPPYFGPKIELVFTQSVHLG